MLIFDLSVLAGLANCKNGDKTMKAIYLKLLQKLDRIIERHLQKAFPHDFLCIARCADTLAPSLVTSKRFINFKSTPEMVWHLHQAAKRRCA